MPIREDLLQPIEGDNPSGANLYYDKVFEQIKDARVEEDDSLPTGEWARAPKKADRVLVIKQAGDLLAKRSKDIRLAGWYVESVVRKEGFGQLVGGIELLWKLQEEFWATLHPELDEDGNADIRIGAVEAASNLIGQSVQWLPLTRTGFNFGQYGDARALGYDADERSDERQAARQDAVSMGRATADDLLKAVNGTPKAFYVETEATLARGLEVLDELERFQEEKYGDDYPSMGKLKSAMEEVKRVVGSVLAEKRKTEPDAVAADAEEPEETAAEEVDPFAQYDAVAEETPEATVVRAAVAAPVRKKVAAGGIPTDAESAYAQVGVSAEFLRGQNAASAVPYLVCSALRLGETRDADLTDGTFAVAPATETRQALRKLANEGSWDELMGLCLRTMVEPCGRVWLDLQRFAWRAAYANGQYAVATAVASTVRALLVDLPDLRTMTLDDDTPAANAETQAWIDAEVLPPVPVAEAAETSAPEPEEVYTPPPPVSSSGTAAAPDIYEMALGVLKQGRMNEAINMLVRDSELQPSGRARFHRRVQMAQLCLAADQAAVAYPVLRDLSSEIERRALETWESGEMLAQPLSLLLRCLHQRKGTEEEREAIFDRLCRLDPQAALGAKR